MTPQLPFSLTRPTMAPVEGLTVVSPSSRWIRASIRAPPQPICEFLNGNGAASGVTPAPSSAVLSTVPGAGSIDVISEVSTPCAPAAPAPLSIHPNAARRATQVDMLDPVEEETILEHDLEQAVEEFLEREHCQPQR